MLENQKCQILSWSLYALYVKCAGKEARPVDKESYDFSWFHWAPWRSKKADQDKFLLFYKLDDTAAVLHMQSRAGSGPMRARIFLVYSRNMRALFKRAHFAKKNQNDSNPRLNYPNKNPINQSDLNKHFRNCDSESHYFNKEILVLFLVGIKKE